MERRSVLYPKSSDIGISALNDLLSVVIGIHAQHASSSAVKSPMTSPVNLSGTVTLREAMVQGARDLLP